MEGVEGVGMGTREHVGRCAQTLLRWAGYLRFQIPLSPWKPPAVLDKLLTVHTTIFSARAGSRAFGRSVHIAMDTLTIRP